jgi:xanthine dehydrogenase/oxidase
MTIAAQQPLTVYVNNTKIIDQNPDPSESLISFLRRNGLTGTKLGCSEGGCGSCTVMVSFYDFSGKKVEIMGSIEVN